MTDDGEQMTRQRHGKQTKKRGGGRKEKGGPSPTMYSRDDASSSRIVRQVPYIPYPIRPVPLMQQPHVPYGQLQGSQDRSPITVQPPPPSRALDIIDPKTGKPIAFLQKRNQANPPHHAHHGRQ